MFRWSCGNVPYILTCLACLCSHVLPCLACLGAHVPTCLACLHANVACLPSCSRTKKASYVLTCQSALYAYVLTYYNSKSQKWVFTDMFYFDFLVDFFFTFSCEIKLYMKSARQAGMSLETFTLIMNCRLMFCNKSHRSKIYFVFHKGMP